MSTRARISSTSPPVASAMVGAVVRCANTGSRYAFPTATYADRISSYSNVVATSANTTASYSYAVAVYAGAVDPYAIPIATYSHATATYSFRAASYARPTAANSVGDEFGDWQEVYFEDEYWQGDPSVLTRPQEVLDLLRTLPRRAKRDALRAMRGSQLRTELYALDQRDPITNNYVPGQGGRPYTVTESLSGVRLEYSPTAQTGTAPLPPFKGGAAGGGFIFFTYSLGSRTTQWERGHDPMTQFSFTADYDQYGQSRKSLNVALPRGIQPPYTSGTGTSPSHEGNRLLSTLSYTTYAQKDDAQTFIVDRTCKAISYEVIQLGTENVFELRDRVFNAELPNETNNSLFPIIGLTLTHYDAPLAFGDGLPLGTLGQYGALARSETLIATDDILIAAYGSIPELYLSPDIQDLSSYPAAFITALQNDDTNLGYVKHLHTEEADYATGYYAESGRSKYDWQLGLGGKGLVLETKDIFENRSTIEYDQYQLLPVSAKQWLNGTDYLETVAQYDYRVLQASMVTDPNGNRSVFRFSPLGLMNASGVIGKAGTDEGDIISESPLAWEPSVRMEYDFLAFHNAQQPVWVKTIQREQHYQDAAESPTIIKVEYTDGFGRLLQTRTQAEDVLFGDSLFGDSGLPADQAENANAVGIQRPATALPNVVVSGWQVYNNKGKVVEQYEPYFDIGFQYIAPFDNATLQSATLGGVFVRMYYDPRGQVVRTVNPDGSQQWVLFGRPTVFDQVSLNELYLPTLDNHPESSLTPWESCTFDANDLADRPPFNGSGAPSTHWNTPKTTVLDALGRTVKTIDRLAAGEEIIMKYQFDIRGNLLKVTDALNRTAFTHVYDLKPKAGEKDKGANILKTTHIDSGTKTALFDAAFKPVELNDAKGTQILHAYDTFSRPIRIWAKDNADESFTLRQKLIYGDDDTDGPTAPENTNHLGKLFEHYDEAGLVTIEEYDFKGNVLQKKREVIADSDILAVFNGSPTDWQVPTYRVDWEGSPTLEGEYVTDMEYDALNRTKKMVYPEDVDTERKELIPTYNRAGALEKVSWNGNSYVEHIAYNSKGQRLLIAFGNGVMTRYTYNPLTFRLARMRSEQYAIDPLSSWTFVPQSGTNRQDIAFDYDLNGNILRRKERRSDCGITGSQLGADALNREFSYDPLNRLLSASGRESNTQNQNDYTYTSSPRLDNYPEEGSPNASSVRAYIRDYAYDKMGNILSMAHSASGNGFSRIFNYIADTNRLQEIETASNALIENYTYDANGNQLTAGTTRNYEWDHTDQLRCYYNQVGTSAPTIFAHYLYDASGQRVKKLVRTSATNWETTIYIDGIFEYQKIETSTDIYERNYLHIMDNKTRIAQVRVGSDHDDIPDTVTYILDDHLGSSNARLNASGGVIDREEYFPFGDSSLRTFTHKRYRYVGREKDSESGLYYYGARYYSAWMCRFISVDALATDYTQLSPYNYSDNNPIGDKDIDGNQNTSSETTNNPQVNMVLTETAAGAGSGNSVQPTSTQAQNLWNSVVSAAKAPGNEQLGTMVSTLQNSTITYKLNLITNDPQGRMGGDLQWVPSQDNNIGSETININIYVPSGVGTQEATAWIINSLGDELTGAYQFEKGEIGFAGKWNVETSTLDTFAVGYDWQDEVESKKGAIMLADIFGVSYVGSAADFDKKVNGKGWTEHNWITKFSSRNGSYKDLIGKEGMSKVLHGDLNEIGNDQATSVRTELKSTKIHLYLYVGRDLKGSGGATMNMGYLTPNGKR
jgi:RHS repeat-associated protein